jgi:hypothetical protein
LDFFAFYPDVPNGTRQAAMTTEGEISVTDRH